MRRVGTLSMGITLILTGIAMLIAQFTGIGFIRWIFKLWPAVLIMLGGEIFYFISQDKNKDLKIRYDFASIIVIFTVLFFSIGTFIIGNISDEALKIFIERGYFH